MKRFLSAIMSLAFVAALASGASATDKMAKSSTMMHSKMKMSCPKGKKYVKGYTKKDGKKVKGYCR